MKGREPQGASLTPILGHMCPGTPRPETPRTPLGQACFREAISPLRDVNRINALTSKIPYPENHTILDSNDFRGGVGSKWIVECRSSGERFHRSSLILDTSYVHFRRSENSYSLSPTSKQKQLPLLPCHRDYPLSKPPTELWFTGWCFSLDKKLPVYSYAHLSQREVELT